MRAATLLSGTALLLLSGLAIGDSDFGHGARGRPWDRDDAPRYRVVEIPGTASVVNANPRAINNFGTIVGYTETNQTAFVWRKGGAPTPLPSTASFTPFTATSINDRGAIAGFGALTDSGGTLVGRAFVRSRQRYTPLDDLPGGVDGSYASDINNRGQVVGYGNSAEGIEPVLWEDGTVTSLADSSTGFIRTQASAINDRGVVVGSGIRANRNVGFVWREGQIHELPAPPGADSWNASDVNNFNVVAGFYGSFAHSDETIAVLWWNGTPHPLPHIDSVYLEDFATSINDLGDVVGASQIPELGVDVATLWHHGTAYNLNDLIADDDPLKPCVRLLFAIGINERGQIAVAGFNQCLSNGLTTYRLEPIRRRH
jgi:uncharacterized membrane protein